VLEYCCDVVLVGHAPDVDVSIREAASQRPDVLLIGQPPTVKSVLPLLAKIRDAGSPAGLVLWVSELSDMDSFRALQMGARGVVTRTQPVEVLIDCVRAVAHGNVWLEAALRPDYGSPAYRRNSNVRITRREREVIEFVCRGMKNKDIAESLSITPGTVKVHLMHIFEKTGVKDRFQLALQGRQILGTSESEPAAVVRVAAEA
jgi:DNA-binding NarL/FixJ family response regulator